MGLYSRYVFPFLCDWFLDRRYFAVHRRQQLADVAGDVLEIGIGTGLNLPEYPSQIRRIAAVDPNLGTNRRLQRRVRQTGISVELRAIGGEQLPFGAESFDVVVSTLTLCSIGPVAAAVAETFRVLKSGGRFEFLEHGRSADPRVLAWQRRLNPLQYLFGDGCRLDLDLRRLLSNSPFTRFTIDEFCLPQIPRTHGTMFRGTAVK